MREAARRGVGGDDEGDGAEDQMHERARHRGDDAGAAARHEDVGDVDVERGHEAVQEGEAELAHATPIVDAGQPMHELVERHAGEEEQLDAQDAEQGATAESLEHVAHVAEEDQRRRGAQDRQHGARDRGDRREDEEPAVVIERLEEPLDVVARDPDALEAGQRELERPHDDPASVARQRRPEPRPRLERQELRALELAQQARDDLEVELAVLQDVRGRDLL